MKTVSFLMTVSAAVIFVSCAGTAARISGERNGAVFEATEVWGNAVQIAEFTPGISKEGVECIEVFMPYGQTAAVWHFSGLEPGVPVEFVIDLNVDFFMKDSFISILLLPGKHGAELGTWPKPDWVQEGLAFKWIDSVR